MAAYLCRVRQDHGQVKLDVLREIFDQEEADREIEADPTLTVLCGDYTAALKEIDYSFYSIGTTTVSREQLEANPVSPYNVAIQRFEEISRNASAD